MYPGISSTTSASTSQTTSGASLSALSESASTTSASDVSQTSSGLSSTISPTNVPVGNNGTAPHVSAKVCAGNNEDPDISGIGVRITFYVTNLLTVAGALLEGFDAEGPFWATWFTSTALLISAATEAGKYNLSLYNAIIVSYHVHLHNLSPVWLLIVKIYCGDRRHARRYFPFTMLQICGFYIYCLYIWSHAKDFGSQPECNSDTKFVFFFKSFSAVRNGPPIAITVLTFLFASELGEVGRYVYDAAANVVEDILVAEPADAVRTVIFLYIPQWVYLVVTTEITIQRNWVNHSPPKYSFGQIFPLVTIGIPVVTIILAILSDDWDWPWFKRHLQGWKHEVVVFTHRAGGAIYHIFVVRSRPTGQATPERPLIEDISPRLIQEIVTSQPPIQPLIGGPTEPSTSRIEEVS